MNKIHRLFLTLILAFGLSLQLTAQKQKVIFDCDLGDDVDDAYALALLMASPEFEVLGVVTDYGNTAKRAQMACRFLYEIGREDVPVVVGRNTKEHYSAQFHWGEGFEKKKPIDQSAPDFIIEQLRKYPDEVILITVGPVPNIADVIDKDPEALKLAKKIYAMFGSFYVGYEESPVPDAEWNVKVEEEAARKFAAAEADIVYAGLDITYVQFDKELRAKLQQRNTPLTDALGACFTLWESESIYKTPTLFDTVPIGMILWPELFSTRPAHVKVIEGGYTVIDESQEPNSTVGMKIDKEEFLRRIMARYLNQNMGRSGG